MSPLPLLIVLSHYNLNIVNDNVLSLLHEFIFAILFQKLLFLKELVRLLIGHIFAEADCVFILEDSVQMLMRLLPLFI